MHTSTFSALAILLSISVLCLPNAQAQKGKGKPGNGGGETSSPTYTVVKLDDANGTLPLASYLGISGINELGGVVGNVGTSSPAFWQIDGTQSQLVLLDKAGGTATACNNLNEIVGAGAGYPSYWASPVSDPVSLDNTTGGAYGISDDGIVCGYSEYPNHSPTLWNVSLPDSNGSYYKLNLPLVPGYQRGVALHIGKTNSNGHFVVVGMVGNTIGPGDLSVRWDVLLDPYGRLTASTPFVIATNPYPGSTTLQVLGMNDVGETCGHSAGEYGYVPMFWSMDGTPSELAILPNKVIPPSMSNFAVAINNAGTIVGQSHSYVNKRQRHGDFATVWNGPQATPIALETVTTSSPFDYLQTAMAINESGVIAGEGRINSESFGFIAIPNQQ